MVVQIGAVRLELEGDRPILDEIDLRVVPIDRNGRRLPLDTFLTRLTGITEARIDSDGLAHAGALRAFDDVSAGQRL